MSKVVSISLKDKRIRKVLDRLYSSAKRDKLQFLRLVPKILKGLLSGDGIITVLTSPGTAKDIYMPITREQGILLYQTARAIKARNIVEFGTSFGVSTIYLASAVRDNGGGVVIGTELEQNKYKQSVRNLSEAGLEDITDIRLGDALDTLKDVSQPIDMVFIDGWKELYIPVLRLLETRLRSGSIVMADNIFTFRKTLRPYVQYVQSGDNGFISTTLPIGEGLEYSVFIGKNVGLTSVSS